MKELIMAEIQGVNGSLVGGGREAACESWAKNADYVGAASGGIIGSRGGAFGTIIGGAIGGVLGGWAGSRIYQNCMR